MEGEARAAGNVDQNSLSTLNGIVFEKRAGDGAVRGIHSAVRSGGHSGAHYRVALAMHDGFHVGKVAVDDAGHGDEFGDALPGLPKDVVTDAEGVDAACATLDGFHQTFLG